MDAVPTAVTTEERIEQAERDQTPIEPAAKVTARKMFRFSEYVDVGEGAAECEHSRDGQCQDIAHFHAWCRMPNPFQHEDIRKKGMASKARKIREMKDPDSDAAVVLDQELAQIDDPAFMETLIDEMLAREWAEDYLMAQGDVQEREEFENVEQDREEYDRLRSQEEAMPEDEQSEEFKRLGVHMTSYVEAIRERLSEVQEPKREELRGRGPETILQLVRDKRVESEGDHAFLNTYNAWMWFVGTLRVDLHPTLGRPHLPMWEGIGHKDRAEAGTMFGEAPEVIERLKEVFNGLQLAMQRASAGN